MIDLKDFATKQIVANPLVGSDHGGASSTPTPTTSSRRVSIRRRSVANTSRSISTRTSIAVSRCSEVRSREGPDRRRRAGRSRPPYTQDLADAGKLGSDGWVFTQPRNTEMAVGGTLDGKPAIESGASQNDMDYLHIINWKKLEELVAAGSPSSCTVCAYCRCRWQRDAGVRARVSRRSARL